jgi:uncharacterized protein (TIGR00255 family)
MISSMTGYGEAQDQIDDIIYAVEIRSLNNRYLKTSVKLPDSVAFLEEAIERMLRESLGRGTVNYVLRLKNLATEPLFDIDEATLRSYIEKLDKVTKSIGFECSVDFSGLLSLPGIVQPVLPEQSAAAKIEEHVLRVSREAIDRLKKMRAEEGGALARDLHILCRSISGNIEAVRKLGGAILRQYHKKLRERVDDLLAASNLKLDEQTLAREVAVFADRCDITEELTRLESHLEQFTASLESDEQVGRKLDFISQEMLREANTVASKAIDPEAARLILETKCRIDRIKEQVQNVE